MALDATVGGTSANSYLTRAAADSYFADRLYSSNWTGASDADKDLALVTATRRIDQENFRGAKVTTTQALKWPRYDTYDADGITYASAAIPQPVKDAACEMALELLGSNTLAQSKLVNFAHIKIGSLDITPQQPQKSGSLPAQVVRLLGHLLLSAPGTIRMVRG